MKSLLLSASVLAGLLVAVSANAQEGAAAADPDLATLMTEGEALFNHNCSGCHGLQGEGGAGFRLDGNPMIQASSAVVGMIINGNLNHGMPPFGGALDDREIAAIATYVRNSWANSYGIVLPSTVAQLRLVETEAE